MDEQDRTQTEMAQTFGVTSLSSKKTVIYENRDEVERQQFITEVAHQEPEQVVFLDESGFDNNKRLAYGYALKGQPCFSRQHGHKSTRHSFITAVRADQPNHLLAPLTFEDYTNGLLFQTWLYSPLTQELLLTDLVVQSYRLYLILANVLLKQIPASMKYILNREP